MPTRNDYFKLHFIVFLWGFSSILGKLILLPAMEMVFFRSILAVAGMAILILILRGNFKVNRIELIKLILIGFIVALHWVAFFGSARVSNVSVSLVGFATNSLWAALLEPLINRSRIKKFELFLGLVVLFGLYVIFSFDFQYKLGLLNFASSNRTEIETGKTLTASATNVVARCVVPPKPVTWQNIRYSGTDA